MKDWRKKMPKRKAEIINIELLIRIYWKCPYCGETMNEHEDLPDFEVYEDECVNCKKKSILRVDEHE